MTEDANYQFIDSDENLIEQCRRWSAFNRLGVDTEFIRTRTYYARLGLVQIFDGEHCHLIDPLCIDDLSPLFDLFANRKVLKILHACSEDLEIFARLAGQAPTPLYDTQVGAALCGLGPSLGYRGLVEALVGIQLAKTEQRSDWLKRPLSGSQLRYAAMDVIHLFELHDQLEERLGALGRTDWILEENQRVERSNENTNGVADPFAKFKIAWKLNPIGAEILYRLVEWRDQTARSRDIPRGHVMPDEALLDIAFQQPDSQQAIRDKTRISPRATGRYGDQLIDLVSRVNNEEESSYHAPPPPPLDLSKRDLVNKMRQIVGDNATRLGLAPETIASRRDLVQLIQDGTLPAHFQGWRMQVIGEQLLQLAAAQDSS